MDYYTFSSPCNSNAKSNSNTPSNNLKKRFSLAPCCIAVNLALACYAMSYAVQASEVSQTIVFSTKNQSVWASGEGNNLVGNTFLGGTWNESGEVFSVGSTDGGGNGLTVDASTSGKVGLDFGYKFNSGTVDATLPMTFVFDTPTRNEFDQFGEFYNIGLTSATLDQGAFVQSFSPTIQAYADLLVQAEATLDVKGCYDIWLASGCGTGSEKIVSIDNTDDTLGREIFSFNTSPDRDAFTPDGELRVLDGFSPFFEAGATVAELKERSEGGQPTKIDLKPKISAGPTPIASVSASLPNFGASDQTTNDRTIIDANDSTPIFENILATAGQDEFLEVDIDVDGIGTALGIIPPLGGQANIDFGVGSVSATLDLIDLSLLPSFSVTQDLELTIQGIDLVYNFDSAVDIITASNQTFNNVTSFEVDSMFDLLQIKWEDQNVAITPEYTINARLSNQTGLAVDFDFNLDLLKGSIAGDIFGFDVGQASFGPLAEANFDLGGIDIPDIYTNEDFALGGFGTIKGTAFEIAVFQDVWENNGGFWDEASQWERGIVPNANTDVRIGDGVTSAQVYLRNSANVGNLNITNNAAVSVSVPLDFDVFGNQVLSIEGGRHTNDGLLLVRDRGTVWFENNARVTGSGTLELSSGTLGSNGNRTVTFIGQNLLTTVGEFGGQNSLSNISVVQENASVWINDNASTNLNFASINNKSAAYDVSGEVTLSNSSLTNIDIEGTLRIVDSSADNESKWDLGSDGIGYNNGSIIIDNSENGSGRSTLTISSAGNSAMTLVNNGQISLIDTESIRTRVNVDSLLTNLVGNGEIVMTGGVAAEIRAANSLTTLIQGQDHTIRGSGRIQGFASTTAGDSGFTNYGLVSADENANRLSIQSISTNYGLYEATNGGRLDILATENRLTNTNTRSGNLFFNTSVFAEDGVENDFIFLEFGNWSASNGGVIEFLASYDTDDYSRFTNRANIELIGQNSDILITKAGTFDSISIDNNLSGIDNLFTFINDGRLSLSNNQFRPDEFINRSQLFLDNNAVVSGVSTNTPQGLIQGNGSIFYGAENGQVVEFFNRGTIRAEGGTLSLNIGGDTSSGVSFVNQGLIEVMDGASLDIGPAFDRTFVNGSAFIGDLGTWSVQGQTTNTVLSISSSEAITDIATYLKMSGEFANFETEVSLGQGQAIFTVGLDASLENIASIATLELNDHKVMNFANTVTNEGVILLNNNAGIEGAGIVNEGDLRGNGVLNIDILNSGLVQVEHGQLLLNPNANITNDLTGQIIVGRDLDNDTPNIERLGDELILNNVQLQNGELIVREAARVSGQGTLSGLSLTNAGTIEANDSAMEFSYLSQFTNTGVVQAGTNLSTSSSFVVFDNTLVDNSGGLISAVSNDFVQSSLNTSADNVNELDSGSASILLGATLILSGNVEVLGADAALSGYGDLNDIALKVVDGNITANVNGQALVIDPSSTAQLLRATLTAKNSSVLILRNGEIDAGGGTLIRAENGSIVELQDLTLNGGRLETVADGRIVNVGDNKLENVSIQGSMDFSTDATLNLFGTNILSGNLQVNENSALQLTNNARLTGVNAQTVVDDNGTPDDTSDDIVSIERIVTPGNLIIEDGAILQGGGLIDEVNITNRGQILANGSSDLVLDSFGTTFTNDGVIIALSDIQLRDETVINNSVLFSLGEIDASDSALQNQGLIRIDGALHVNTLDMNAGVLDGDGGAVYADAIKFHEGAELFTAENEDSLSIVSDVKFDGTWNIDIFSFTDFDNLLVEGDFLISELTSISFNFMDDFVFADETIFDVLYASTITNFNLLNDENISFTGLSSRFNWIFEEFDGGAQLRISNGTLTGVSAPPTLGFLALFTALYLGRKIKR